MSGTTQHVLGIEILLPYVGGWPIRKEHGFYILVEALAKLILQFILRIICKPKHHATRRTEVETVLSRIAVENLAIQRMTIPLGVFADKGSHLTTTNPVYLSKLEACFERATITEEIHASPGPHAANDEENDESSAELVLSIPGLHELATEVKSSDETLHCYAELIEYWMDKDIMWRVDDLRLQVSEMWVEEDEMDIDQPDEPSKRRRLA